MKTVVVTGAAQGLGREVAERFARAGWALALTDIQPLDALAEQLATEGTRVSALSGDQSDLAFVERLAAEVARVHGSADVLVNNAGISSIGPAEDVPPAQWERVQKRSQYLLQDIAQYRRPIVFDRYVIGDGSADRAPVLAGPTSVAAFENQPVSVEITAFSGCQQATIDIHPPGNRIEME